MPSGTDTHAVPYTHMPLYTLCRDLPNHSHLQAYIPFLPAHATYLLIPQTCTVLLPRTTLRHACVTFFFYRRLAPTNHRLTAGARLFHRMRRTIRASGNVARAPPLRALPSSSPLPAISHHHSTFSILLPRLPPPRLVNLAASLLSPHHRQAFSWRGLARRDYLYRSLMPPPHQRHVDIYPAVYTLPPTIRGRMVLYLSEWLLFAFLSVE